MDINNDGLRDIIHGNGNGEVLHYLGNNDGTFKEMGALQANGSRIHFSYYSFLEVVDWNEDGLWDLLGHGLVKKKEPNLVLYINKGTKEQYSFDNILKYKEDGGIGIPYIEPRICPTVADFDYDGKKDILLGNMEGKLEFYKNIGTNSSPEFDVNNKEIISNDAGLFWTDQQPELKADIADLNGDGQWDIIAGAASGKKHISISYGYGGGGITNKKKTVKPIEKSMSQLFNVQRLKNGFSVINNSSNYANINIYNAQGVKIFSYKKLNSNDYVAIKNLSVDNFYIMNIVSNGKGITKKIINID